LLERIRPLGDAFDDLHLVGLVAEQLQRPVAVDLLAFEALVLLDDALHLPLDPLEVLGRERALDVEVVIEAVGDRGTDRVFGSGIELEHCLCKDVGARVSDDLATLFGVGGDDLDLGVFGRDVREVPLTSVDPERERRARFHLFGESEAVLGSVCEGGGTHRDAMLSAQALSNSRIPSPIVRRNDRSSCNRAVPATKSFRPRST
jgi:hypothetical protein